MLIIPEDFKRKMLEIYGKEGAEWLAKLPALVAQCEMRWSLKVGPPFAPLSYNYVAPALRADGTKVVVKVGFPNPEFLREAEALRICDGRGMVSLLDTDQVAGAMLLERLVPGGPLVNLASLNDEEATSIAAGVMKRLWRPVPPGHGFASVRDWAEGLGRLRAQFDGGTGPFPVSLVREAEVLFADLLVSMSEPALLHGDLHHWNILSAVREPWLALDPKGLIGEPAYEVGALLRNPLPQDATTLKRRVDQLSEELGFDRARVRGWGMAQAVLSGWWSFEDEGHGWEPAIACATLLSAIKE